METPYNVRMPESKPLVAVIMGSKSDWDTMRNAVETLDELGVPNEARVLSAHRTPDATAEFARGAVDRGVRVIIAGAGGAAHLAGVIAAHTWLPVLGVPIQSKLQGLDSLLSTAQMPGGIPVGTLAIERFLRPVCYQDFPDDLLSPELQQSNPLSLRRMTDGKN